MGDGVSGVSRFCVRASSSVLRAGEAPAFAHVAA